MIGIYAIQRRDSAECYIGSAVSLAKRWRDHRSNLRNGKHDSLHMQNVWNKHGADVFEFVILEDVADKALLIEREQAWLTRFSPAYNTCRTAGNSLGTKRSAEARAKMSAWQNGRTLSAETRAKMSAAQTGKRHTAEARAKIAAANVGNTHAAETRAKISAAVMGNTNAAGNKGRKHTPERIAAIGAGMAAARAQRIAA